jgi:hypothetical protein
MHLKWNYARPAAGPEGRKPERNGSHNEQGLEVKDALSPSGRRRTMSLTFPLIDQALTLKTLFQGSMSSIKRDVKKKGSASTGVEICFSRPSPLSIGFAAGVLPFDSHKFLC